MQETIVLKNNSKLFRITQKKFFSCFVFVNNSACCWKMVILCRGENCNESFSIKLNRNKHKNLKKYRPSADVKTKIPLNEKRLYHCPADGCTVEFKYKQKLWSIWNRATHWKRKGRCCQKQGVPNYLQSICTKIQPWQTQWHRPDSNTFDGYVEPIEDEKIPSMVFPADPIVPVVVDNIPTTILEEDDEDVVQPNQQSMSQDDKILHTH